MRPHLQNNQRKMHWSSGSKMKCLLCKNKPLISNPSIRKKKKRLMEDK
jgi:hypothetical protein